MQRDDRGYFSAPYIVSSVLIGLAIFLLGRAAVRLEHAIVGPAAGNFGYTPDPAGTRAFLDELGDERYFSQAAPECMEKAAEVDAYLWRAMDKAHRARYGKPFVVGRQGIGDCTSWGGGHAVYCSEAIDWDMGRLPEPPMLPATEPLYGGARVEISRNGGKPYDGSAPIGGWSDGSSGYAVAKFLRDFGVVYRENQPASGVDLTTYSPDRAKQFGAYGCGGHGDNGRMDATAKKHPCTHVVAVRNWDELAAAIGSGFPVTLASSQGFSSTRDADGFCAAQGTWMHQLCAVGIRFAKNARPGTARPRDGVCILNSWGPMYVSGPKFPADQLDGSFWAERSVVERMLGDAWAIGSVDGWKWRDINHREWLAPPPPPQPALHRFPFRMETARLVADVFRIAL